MANFRHGHQYETVLFLLIELNYSFIITLMEALNVLLSVGSFQVNPFNRYQK